MTTVSTCIHCALTTKCLSVFQTADVNVYVHDAVAIAGTIGNAGVEQHEWPVPCIPCTWSAHETNVES